MLWEMLSMLSPPDRFLPRHPFQSTLTAGRGFSLVRSIVNGLRTASVMPFSAAFVHYATRDDPSQVSARVVTVLDLTGDAVDVEEQPAAKRQKLVYSLQLC